MLISSGPHHTNIGNLELRHISTATRKLPGQFSHAPSFVRDQSNVRTRSAIDEFDEESDPDRTPVGAIALTRTNPPIARFPAVRPHAQQCAAFAWNPAQY